MREKDKRRTQKAKIPVRFCLASDETIQVL